MVRVECEKWGQTAEDLRAASINADHPRTRERFQALYHVAAGLFNAATWAAHAGRRDETVLAWVHAYNREGPGALAFRHTGGRAPLLRRPRHEPSATRPTRPGRPSTACPATCGP